MFRALIFALATVIALPAAAEQHTALIGAGDTAQMTVGATQAIAFYTTDRKGMRVTMVFTDSDGETMRTRILLDDGQSHAIVLDASEEEDDGYRFSFRRDGNTVEMTGADRSGLTKVAARY